jgi:hypothetical protein
MKKKSGIIELLLFQFKIFLDFPHERFIVSMFAAWWMKLVLVCIGRFKAILIILFCKIGAA